VVPSDLIPLSHLELDLAVPVEGWAAFLTDRHIAIELDDIGRASVSRDDARQILAEKREDEQRRREAAARAERQAIEQDQQRREAIWTGAPASAIPEGASPGLIGALRPPDGQRAVRDCYYYVSKGFGGRGVVVFRGLEAR
jgi:hypothetical protein